MFIHCNIWLNANKPHSTWHSLCGKAEMKGVVDWKTTSINTDSTFSIDNIWVKSLFCHTLTIMCEGLQSRRRKTANNVSTWKAILETFFLAHLLGTEKGFCIFWLMFHFKLRNRHISFTGCTKVEHSKVSKILSSNNSFKESLLNFRQNSDHLSGINSSLCLSMQYTIRILFMKSFIKC